MNRADLTKAQRWEIADRLAEERLPKINNMCAEVVFRETFYTRYIKRVFDFLIALLVLIVTMPINLVLAIGTLLDVGFPIFFKQERVGENQKIFSIYKFRNMKNTRDEKGDLLPPAQRVTKFGKFVRKTSLDELLNFWSILKGDMSIIGPRPLVTEYTHRYSDRHKKRLAVRPGLECPPRSTDYQIWTWQEQLENDIWYVENISFKTDCYMVFKLIQFTFSRKSSSVRAVSARGPFMGYDIGGKAINLDGVPQEYIDAYEYADKNIGEKAV